MKRPAKKTREATAGRLPGFAGTMGMALLLALGPLPGTAQQPVIRLGDAMTNVAPGVAFDVPVVLEMPRTGALDVAGVTFIVEWDPAELTYASAAPGSFGAFTINEGDAGTLGRLAVSGFDPQGTTATEQVLTLSLRANVDLNGVNTLVEIGVTRAGNVAGQNITSTLVPQSLLVCISSDGLRGDIDGDAVLDILDAHRILLHTVGLGSDSALVAARGDVNEDGQLDVLDALALARHSVGYFSAAAPNIGAPLPGECSPPSGLTYARYIVRLTGAPSSGVAATASMEQAQGFAADFVYGGVLPGFAAQLSPSQLAVVRDDPLVDWVEADAEVSITGTQTPTPSWGLDRIDQKHFPGNGTYTFNATGAGVAFYGLDTGIRSSHQDFGGRIGAGVDFVLDGNGTADCNGHGTHTASTAAGSTFGVAKGMTVVPVRVLNCAGSGTFAQVIAGVDWVAANATLPAVANMSLTGGGSSILDAAVANAVSQGIVFSVAAGNLDQPACSYSPARAPSAVTVASTTTTDARSGFSNWGSCVDLFAPGSGITAAWATSDNATNTMSGTSMAAPHVAGVAGLVLETDPSATPAEVRQAIVENATQGVVGTPGSGSPNLLLYMGFIPDQQPVTAPIDLGAVSLSPGAVDLTWTNTFGGDGWIEIARDDSKQVVDSVDAASTAFSLAGLNPGTSYHFYVRACAAAGCSAWTGPAGKTPNGEEGPPPLSPTNLVAVSINAGEVDLGWTDNSGLETRFEIAQDDSKQVVKTVEANGTTASFTGLNTGTSYHFYVRACGIQSTAANSVTEAKCSAWTGPAGKTPNGEDGVVPPVPANLATVSNAPGEVILSWTVTGTPRIEIGNGLTPDSMTATTAFFSGLNPGVSYHFYVRACAAANCSAWAGPAGRTPNGEDGPPPPAPANLVAVSHSPGNVDLSWVDNSDLETRFEIALDDSRQVVRTVGANVTTFSLTGLNPGVSYHFYVRACGIQSVGANSITEAKCSAWTGPTGKTPDGSG